MNNIKLLGLSQRAGALGGAYDKLEEEQEKERQRVPLVEPNLKFNMQTLYDAERQEIKLKLNQSLKEPTYDEEDSTLENDLHKLAVRHKSLASELVPLILRTINETRSDHERSITDISAEAPSFLPEDPIIPLLFKGGRKPQLVAESLTASQRTIVRDLGRALEAMEERKKVDGHNPMESTDTMMLNDPTQSIDNTMMLTRYSNMGPLG